VPNDIELSGSKETFTAMLTSHSLDLYGKVEATVPIVIESAETPPTEKQ
jgi:hypothetical protein